MLRTYTYSPERPRRQPSPQRAKVLDFIRSQIASGHSFPSLQAISAHMGWKKTASAYDALNGLMADGWVTASNDLTYRTWSLRPETEAVS